MLTLTDYRVHQARIDDMLREAEQRAIVARATADNDDPALLAATLATVGKAMVEIGSRLEARYGTLADDTPPTTQSAGC